MARYALTDKDSGTVLNIIEWDGAKPYDLGVSLELRPTRTDDEMPEPQSPLARRPSADEVALAAFGLLDPAELERLRTLLADAVGIKP